MTSCPEHDERTAQIAARWAAHAVNRWTHEHAPEDIAWLLAERERLAAECEALRTMTMAAPRVCDRPGCTAANIRHDDGSVHCAAGHPTRWVDVADAEGPAIAKAVSIEVEDHRSVLGASERVYLRVGEDFDLLLHIIPSNAPVAQEHIRKALAKALAKALRGEP